MRYFILLGIFCLPLWSLSQAYNLQLDIKNLSEKEIYLTDFYGDKNTFKDTTITDTSGFAVFTMQEKDQPGMYRVFLDKNIFFDIVYNRENIRIKSNMEDLYESLVVVESHENKIYYDFLRKMNDYNRKFDLLAPVIDYYPRKDSFFVVARQEYDIVQGQMIHWIDSTAEVNPEKWVARIIQQRKPIYFDPSLNEFGRREYAKAHFFDHVDFTDVDLIRSNVYSSMAIEYMSLFSNPNMNQDQLQDEFVKAVDKIMYESMDNSMVYQFMVEYLVGGFEKYHFDKVLDYIAENYTPEQCENEDAATDLQTRLQRYAELSVGKKAPTIEIADQEGNPVSLYELKSNYTLIIFWSSTCPHCLQTLPEIERLYDSSLKTKQLTIFTVSLDTDKAAWEEALQGHYKEWINTSELKGWNTKAAVDYNVYATPTMFLLDKNNSILAKPITLGELNAALIKEDLMR
jgi:thiol-disulfide isomerase/thioredoxin